MGREILTAGFVSCQVKDRGKIRPQPPEVNVLRGVLVENFFATHPNFPRKEIVVATGPKITPGDEGYSVRLEKR